MPADQATRKQRGAWYTPADLVDIVVDGLVDDLERSADLASTGRPLSVLDPACGDGRLLTATRAALASRGIDSTATGCDIDAAALAAVGDDSIELIQADALSHDWANRTFDIVVGNPPFLSQMATGTTRGGASRHGGGPYANAAVEFLALAIRLAEPSHGRVVLVLPTSVLGARDAIDVRATVDALAALRWSWWEAEQSMFDAAVHVCVIGWRRPADREPDELAWTSVVTDRLGIPRLDQRSLATDGTIGDRAHLSANFRDEYYALVPAVGDDVEGPPLVTSGIIDPARCRWGQRPVRFAKQRFERPRVDLDLLNDRFVTWASSRLVPKVLVANQTTVIEAVADRDGTWIPGVPVTSIVPPARADTAQLIDEIEAVLTSPVATALAWHATAGTGLSSHTVRISPAALGAVAWPAGSLGPAVASIAAGDIVEGGRLVTEAYDIRGARQAALMSWWSALLPDDDA